MLLRVTQGITILYVVVLTLLLELPSAELTPIAKRARFDFFEGIEHLTAFILLGVLVELCRRKKSLYFWICILICYSVGSEVGQKLLEPICHRFFDWRDGVQNMLGVLIGTSVGYFVKKAAIKIADKSKPLS